MSDAIDRAIANGASLAARERGWHLNVRHRARIVRGRAMVQAPTEEQRQMVAAIAGAGKVEGIPFDVLMTLEAIRQLAEQGNVVAARLYDEERKKLGIDRPLFSFD